MSLINKKYVFQEDIEKKEKKNQPIFNDMDYISSEENALMSNPFEYSISSSSILVNTIEDFGVRYKKSNVHLGSVLRNELISKRRKIKIFKKYLKNNKRQFLIRLKQLRNTNEENKEMFDKAKFIKDKLFVGLLVYLGLIISFFIIYLFNIFAWNIIPSGWLENLSNILYQGFQESNVIKTLVIGSGILDIILILYLIIYQIIKNRYFGYQKDYKKKMRKTLKGYDRNFKKAYKRIYNHYLKALKKSDVNYDAIGMMELWKQKNNFDNIFKVNNLIQEKTDKIIKYQKKHRIIKELLYGVLFSTDILLIVYTVVHGIIKI